MLTVLTGPPCGGKTTKARQSAGPADIIVDLDALAVAFGYPGEHVEWETSHPACLAARAARAHVINSLLNRRITCNAWIIDATPDRAMLAQYRRAGARLELVDPGREVCLERARSRPVGTIGRIEAWYASRGVPGASPALGIFGR